MQATKLRAKANGLVPAGAYFADIAAKLEEMNARAASRRAELDEEDRALEVLYRGRSATRITSIPEHAMM
jgi:hypothetical protein